MLEIENPHTIVSIERLRLAAWLQLNGERLLERHLQDDGKIIYRFRRSDKIDKLVKQWDHKSCHELVLSRFSGIVSFEIQKAVRMRRAAGLPTRIRSIEKS